MTPFDYAVLAIVGVSILISVIRGLVREVLALVAWAAAFVVATLFGARMAAVMPAGPEPRISIRVEIMLVMAAT